MTIRLPRLPALAAPALALSALAASLPAIAGEVPDATAAALANPDVITVRNVTRAELAMGLPIADSAGQPLGTVVRPSGPDVILRDDDGDEFAVPMAQLYAFNQNGADHYASRLPREQLAAGTPAAAIPQKGG